MNTKVAIKGIGGSFHDQAAQDAFGQAYTPLFCRSFIDIIRKVSGEEADFGILAIENSLAGTILENYRLLRDNLIEITGERYLQIDHNLLALPGTQIDQIEAVFSHEMALKQCQQFLDKQGIINRKNYIDTASATQLIRANDMRRCAAIGSIEAAHKYGLEVLSKNIQDNPKNYTRFLIIQKVNNKGLSIVKNKATIIFSVEDKVGRLAHVLNFLNNRGINLSKIESVPQLNEIGKFDMITDLQLPEGQQFKDVLPDLYNYVEQIKVLGVYERADQPLSK